MAGVAAQQPRLSLYLHLPYCEQLCTYCGCNKRITVNHAVEQPYFETLLQEWAMYRQLFPKAPVLDELHLGGGTPTFFSPENLTTYLGRLLSTVAVAPDATLSVEVHPNVTTKQHLEALAALGFNRLSVGIQDFDPQVQAIINRHQTYERTAEVFAQARALGIEDINADLVFGLPRQSLATIRHTFSLLRELRPSRISFYSYAHVPWKSKGQRRYDESDLPAGPEKRALYELGRKMLFEQGYQEIGMDHFALPADALYQAKESQQLHRNFMGYTERPSELLIGLGASAISDSGGAYAQNHTVIEDWAAAIHAGQLSMAKGHLLSPEDQLLKGHILNIICHMHTSWTAEESTPWLEGVADRLATMAEEGLVLLGPHSVTVLEAGRPFLRHVCMAFDARLAAQNKEATAGGKQFSRGV